MMGRRQFNRGEHVALYLAADGKCESCGVTLETGWHGDHVIPWSLGGPTDVINGQALCPPCNQQKGATMNSPHDEWQARGLATWRGKKGPDFLADVTPGAGKTRFALRCGAELLTARDISLIIVVVPTTALRSHWRKSAAKFNIDLDAAYKLGPVAGDLNGIVVTYGAVGSNPLLFRQLVGKHKGVLVIFDEVHHVADEKHWGTAVTEAFETADHRLALTGTAFRCDGATIPFIRYKDTQKGRVSAADFSYLYPEARRDGVVATILFSFLTATVEYDRDGRTRKLELNDDIKSWLEDDTLRAATNPRVGQFVATALRRGDDELTEQRAVIPTAAGIVFAKSIPDANYLADLMGKICGASEVVVVHGPHPDYPLTSDPVDDIEKFKTSSVRWIVAVQMVSEGIDIPRLQVGVYLSNRKTELWFRQVLGRLVRVFGGDAQPEVMLLLPWIRTLHEYAETMDEEVIQGLEGIKPPGTPGDGEPRGESSFAAMDSTEAMRDHLIDWAREGDRIQDVDLLEAERIRRAAGVMTTSVTDVARLFAELRKTQTTGHVPPQPTPQQSETEIRQAERESLRKNIGARVKAHAFRRQGRISYDPPPLGVFIKEIWGVIYEESGIQKKLPGATWSELQSYDDVLRKWAAAGTPWD